MSAQLPPGATMRPAPAGGPRPEDEVYEWTADRTFDELPAAEIHRRSEHVAAVYRKWHAKSHSIADPAARDDQARQIMLAVDQECIEFSRRFPHRFRQPTDSTLAGDPLMQRHQAAMLEIFRRRQAGEITENRAKQLVSQLAQRTILDKTAALPPDELARRRAERAAEGRAGQATGDGAPQRDAL